MQEKLAGNPERRRGGLEFLLHRAAETFPNRVAIDDRLNGVRRTYAALRCRSIQLARGLDAMGVREGNVVMTAFRNEVFAIEAIFACAMIGAVVAPLNSRLAPVEARQFIDRQGARTFVGAASFVSFIEGTGIERVVIQSSTDGPGKSAMTDYEELLQSQSGVPFPPRASLDSPYMIGMTGGTTGGSKGAVWSHGGVLLDMLSIISHWNIRPGQKALCSAPIYHAAGLGWACLPILWQAGTVVFPEKPSFDPGAILDALKRDGIECLFLVPAMIAPLYRQWDQTPLTNVRSLAVASAPTPKRLRIMLAEMFPAAECLVCYGMTECFSITMQRPSDFVTHGEGVGEPALAARVRIVDDAGDPVPTGVAGQVVARTLGQALSYNNDPANTEATFKPLPGDPEGLEWVHTGDIGVLGADGRVTLVDRAKDVIITGGENVASPEVESVLLLHPEVRECAVFGVSDDRWGEMVCAAVVSAEGAGRQDLAASLLTQCRDSLAGYKVPKRIVFVEALPRNAFGKVLKRNLRAQRFDEMYDADQLRSGVTSVG